MIQIKFKVTGRTRFKKNISIILNDFESYNFGRGCLRNIRFTQYCFSSLTGRKADEKQESI